MAEARALLGPVVGDDEHLRAHQGHVGAPKPVHDADGEHAVPALQVPHARHEVLHGLALRLQHVGHAGVEHRGDRAHLAARHPHQQVHELAPARRDVGVRVLAKAHEQRVVVHGRAQVRMRVELAAHRHLRPHDLAHARQDVALAVVVTLRHHATVHVQGHDVHGQRLAQPLQQLVAQRLVGSARHGRSWGGIRVEPAHHLQPERLRVQRHVATVVGVEHLLATPDALALEGRQPDRDGREGVRLGHQTAEEEPHRHGGGARPRFRLRAGTSSPRRHRPARGCAAARCAPPRPGALRPGRAAAR